MKKIFTLAAAVLASFSLWAAVETEVYDATGASSSVEMKKTSSTLPALYVAGQGGGPITGYSPENKGVKLNTQKSKVTVSSVEYGYVMITVHPGYALRSIKIEGTSNGSNAIDLFGIFADVNTENLAASLESGNLLGSKVSFPNKNTDYVSSPAITLDASSNALLQFAGSGDSQMRAIITVDYERTATCDDPTIAWAVEPEGGKVGDADFVASVSTPAGQTISWASSVPEVATVGTDGKIHYVASGLTTITASYTYVGTDYCNNPVSISKIIAVPIESSATAANDNSWYYQDAAPTDNPDNGLTYKETKAGSGMFGVKLNSEGYAWFVKAAEKGTLRVGAYYSGSNTNAYEVEVYACDNAGNKSGDALGTLSTPYAGGVSDKMNIAADVTGLYIKRKTGSEGVLYFIEFKAGDEATSIDNTEASVKTVKTIENGQLVIIKNGVKYNAQGAIVK